MPTPLLLDPGNWNSTVVAPYTLGAFYETGGKTYQYVQLVDLGATNGMVVEPASATAHSVTVVRVTSSSICDGTAAGTRQAVGVIVGTVTINNYCFIQVEGIHPAVIDAVSSLPIGAKFTAHVSTPGNAVVVTSALNGAIGYTTAAAAGGTVSAILRRGG